MKHLIILIVLLACIGCGKQLPTATPVFSLDTPTLSIVGNTLVWNKVNNANGYYAKIKWHVQYQGDDSTCVCGADTSVFISHRPSTAYVYAFNNVDKVQSSTIILTIQ